VLNILEEDKNNSLVIPKYDGAEEDEVILHFKNVLKFIAKKQSVEPCKY
jgi:hypothetical protein